MSQSVERGGGKELRSVLPRYEERIHWFHSFMTDLTGERYKVDKSPADRLREYQVQIERTGVFLDFLGRPQDKFPSLHIAGTGGKAQPQ